MTKEPIVETSSKFNFFTSIWIVPFLALMIAGWLLYQYYQELGPEIRITFPTNEGLQAGQSHIKYRDVPIGTIKKIELQEDGKGVVVIARMDKTAAPYLNEHSKFWIVKPEVGLSGISGLDTLISGTYIKMYGKKGGERKYDYKGLTRAYRVTEDGTYFKLNTPQSANLRIGTPIYYKNIVVGEVEYMPIALDNQSIDVIIRIQKKYASYVTIDSKFWIKNMVAIDVEGGSLSVNVAPLSHLIQGGIAFSSSDINESKKLPEHYTFPLYKSAKEAKKAQITSPLKEESRFIIQTKRSVAKLSQGAPVKYEGFTIGKVANIQLSYNAKQHRMSSHILLHIHTGAFYDTQSHRLGKENFYQAVKEGLRAHIRTSDPITQTLFVDLAFDKNATKEEIVLHDGYAYLPLVEEADDAILAQIKQLLSRINALPMDRLFKNIEEVVNETKKPIANLDVLLVEMQKSMKDIHQVTQQKAFKTMPSEVNKMLKSLTHTLYVTKKVLKGYDSHSVMSQQLSQTLKVVTETSKEMKHFLEMLNRKPNSLIFGDK